jgi:hypothetical protein
LGNDRYRFSVGASFGVLFMTGVPFEIKLRYDTPVVGKNDFASHIISLSGTLRLPLPPKKPAALP